MEKQVPAGEESHGSESKSPYAEASAGLRADLKTTDAPTQPQGSACFRPACAQAQLGAETASAAAQQPQPHLTPVTILRKVTGKLMKYWTLVLVISLGFLIYFLLIRPPASEHLKAIKGISFASVLLLAILNHWEKPHSSTTNKLTKRGLWVFHFMVLSAFTSVAAFQIDEKRRDGDSRQRQEALSSQIQYTTNILAQLQSHTLLLEQSQSLLSKQQSQTTELLEKSQTQASSSRQTLTEIARLLSPATAPQVTILCDLLPVDPLAAKVIKYSSHFASESAKGPIVIPTGYLTGNESLGNLALTSAGSLFSLLITNPPFSLTLFAPSNNLHLYSSADFSVRNPQATEETRVFFRASEPDKLTIRWIFQLNSDTLKKTPALYSLSDIPGSALRLALPNEYAPWVASLAPRAVVLNFQSAEMLITNFQTLATSPPVHVHTPAPFFNIYRETRDAIALFSSSLDEADFNFPPRPVFAATLPDFLSAGNFAYSLDFMKPAAPQNLRLIRGQ